MVRNAAFLSVFSENQKNCIFGKNVAQKWLNHFRQDFAECGTQQQLYLNNCTS